MEYGRLVDQVEYGAEQLELELVWSRRNLCVWQAVQHILNATILLCLVCFAFFDLDRVIADEVVEPMENILKTITQFSLNPLKRFSVRNNSLHPEAVKVEKSLVRLGSILSNTLGEAGCDIISHNMLSGRMCFNIPGKVVQAFFGFCDIRNFTDITEILTRDVVKVVNTFADIVHTAVTDNEGIPNKNIGDAFLVVWKPKQGISAQTMAENALRSYVRVILVSQTSQRLLELSSRPEIQQRIPGFKMRMGFGIHYGWGIECAIGSQFKIEASYLSPHVNMAARLEGATKQYGVAILISEATHALFAPAIQQLCRRLDRVTLKGSDFPMDLYTYDVAPARPDHDVSDFTAPVPALDFFQRVAPPWSSREFRARYNQAVGHYLGDTAPLDWHRAVELFEECLNEEEDEPCRRLMQFIYDTADSDGEPPRDWPGYRQLIEK